jgi:hypothetical protein
MGISKNSISHMLGGITSQIITILTLNVFLIKFSTCSIAAILSSVRIFSKTLSRRCLHRWRHKTIQRWRHYLEGNVGNIVPWKFFFQRRDWELCGSAPLWLEVRIKYRRNRNYFSKKYFKKWQIYHQQIYGDCRIHFVHLRLEQTNNMKSSLILTY